MKKKFVLSFLFLPVFFMCFTVHALLASNIEHLVFSRDKTQLVYVTDHDIIKISTATGKIIKRTPFSLHNKASLLEPTVDGLKLLSVHKNGIDVIHNGLGKVLRTLPHPSGQYDWQGQPIRQNASGTLLAIPSLKPALPRFYLIHTGTGKVIRTLSLISEGERWDANSKIGAVGFSQNQHLLAYTRYIADEATLQLYDINQQRRFSSFLIDRVNKRDVTDVTQDIIQFSRNGQQILLATSNSQYIQFIDLRQQTVKTINYGCRFVGFSADDKQLLCIQPQKRRVLVYAFATGRVQTHLFPVLVTQSIQAEQGVQSADRTLLALPLKTKSETSTGDLLLIDGRTGRFIRRLTVPKRS